MTTALKQRCLLQFQGPIKSGCRQACMWPPCLEAGEGVSTAGCLGMRCLILSAKERSMEDRSVQKTSLFTNTVPESASGTLIPPEFLGSYSLVEHSHFRLCISTRWCEDTTWKPGTSPSGGQAPSRDPLLPGCFRGCCWQVPLLGELLCGSVQMGGLPEVPPAGPS